MKLHHIAFKCIDYKATSEFYEKVFSLKVIRRQDGYSTWFSVGEGILMIEQIGSEILNISSESIIIFRIDKDQLSNFLKNAQHHGILPFKNTDFTWYFKDPDGRTCGISFYNDK